MTTQPISVKARLLSRHLRDKGLAELTHSQALEALAHAENHKSFNVLKSATHPQPGATDETPQALLRRAIAAGLRPGEALSIFAEKRDALEAAYLSAARQFTSEGDLEFDVNAVVSLSDDGGAYVQAWKWVSAEDVEPVTLATLFLALGPTGQVDIEIEDQGVDDSYIGKDLEVLPAFVQWKNGLTLAPQTVLVRGTKKLGDVFALTAAHFESLKAEPDNKQHFSGVVDGYYVSVTFFPKH